MWFKSNSLSLLLSTLSITYAIIDQFTWINSLNIFQKHDQLKSQELQELIGHLGRTMRDKYRHDKKAAADWIKDLFYRLYAQPEKNVCSIAKNFGGVWLDDLNVPDGVKHICLDKVFQDVKTDECLVYSFGLSDDWSFEQEMVQIGCKVRAFDPTVEDENGLHDGDRFKFAQIGIADMTGTTQIESIDEEKTVMTLSDSMKYMGDEGKNLTILKVDIETMEFRCLEDWFESGILNRVDQIQMEIHNSDLWFPEETVPFRMVDFLAVLYFKYNFRIINYSPNLWMEKSMDTDNKYYTFFDVTFKKIENK